MEILNLKDRDRDNENHLLIRDQNTPTLLRDQEACDLSPWGGCRQIQNLCRYCLGADRLSSNDDPDRW